MMESKNRMRAVIDAYGIGQKGFAEKYGIPYRTVQAWHDGTSNPPEYIISLFERVQDLEEREKRIEVIKNELSLLLDYDFFVK